MKTTQPFGRKVTVLSILAMLAVVFIHSTAYLTMAHPAAWNVFAETLVTRSFSRWAVPFFFAVSGFWFGRGRYIAGREGYGALCRTKGRTLLIPYLCWCVQGFIIAMPLIMGTNIIGGKALFERTIAVVPGIWPKIDAFFGITLVGPKSNMPLWYVRCLLVMFLLAPLWRVALRVPFGRWLLAAFAFAQTLAWPVPVPWLSVPTFAFGWFAAGLVLSTFEVESWRVPTSVLAFSSVAYAVGSFLVSALAAGYVALPAVYDWHGWLENGFVPLVGIITVWGLYDRLPWFHDCPIPWGVRQTFFIYCLHEIVCSYFMATIKVSLGKTDVVTFVCTLVVPWLSFGTCIGVAWLANRLFPRGYGVVCGGRV